MGLDLYAGTLARYYTGRWETEAQQVGRAIGMPAEIVYANGGPRRLWKLTAPWRVSAWRRKVRAKYARVIKQPLDWPEDTSVPYFARKPDHAGRRALVLAGAYAERPQFAMPIELPNDIESDTAYLAIGEGNYLHSVISIFECQMYLPSAEDFIFCERDPVGNKRFIASTTNLDWALGVVNEAHWSAESTQIDEWASNPPTGRKKVLRFGEGGYKFDDEDTGPESLQSFAKFGFAIYSKALAFSREHNVPILTDE